MKKMFFVLMLFIPVLFINATTYNSGAEFAGQYMDTGDYKFSYNKYIYTPTDKAKFYSNDSSKFKKGGFLSLDEFNITLKNGTQSLHFSYLYESNPFWTLTKGNISSGNRKAIDSNMSEIGMNDSSNVGVKVTEYVLPSASVSGLGSVSDPFLFAPQYKVMITVNNSERGSILDKNGNKLTVLEEVVTENVYKVINIQAEGKYEYIGSTCGIILNDIQAKSGKLILNGVTRDTECTINFGEKPITVNLDQTYNNSDKSSPQKLYVLPHEGWYTDQFANYSIGTLTVNPVRIGYTYKGYYLSSNEDNACNGTLIIGEDKKLLRTKSVLETFTNNQVLYACYNANTYTVSFDKNTGDSLSTTSKTVTFDQSYGELPIPVKTGYSFLGWYTDVNGGEKIESGTKMTLDRNHTLYARWTANTNTPYVVNHWLQNIGAGSTQNSSNYSLVASISHTGTSDSVITAEKSNYAGFSQPSDKKITISRDGSSVVNYYYTRNSYAISYDGNGCGTPSFANKSIQYDANYVLPTISATGFTFNGWYTASTGGNKVDSSTKLSTTSNHTLYAHCTVNSYSVTLNKGTGIVSVNGAGTYHFNKNVTIDATVQAGYTFSGWTGDFTSNSKTYSFNLPARNVTLTANARPNTYTVSYNCNGGSGSAGTTSHTYGVASNVRVNNFCSRVGYTFAGWNTAANGSGTNVGNGASVTNLTTTANGLVTLYAKWTPNKYTITFNANGGSIATPTMTVTYDQALGNLPTPTKTGYRFMGWFLGDARASRDSNILYKDRPMLYYSDYYTDLYNAYNYNDTLLATHYINWGKNEGRRLGQFISTDIMTTPYNFTVYAGWIREHSSAIAISSYVKYTGNGYSSWRVLFNNAGGQIDLVSKTSTENFTLYGTDGYHSAVKLLYDNAQKYKSGIATGARSVGMSADSVHVSVKRDNPATYDDDKNDRSYKDSYWEIDFFQLNNNNMKPNVELWLASRWFDEVDLSSDWMSFFTTPAKFGVRTHNADGSSNYHQLAQCESGCLAEPNPKTGYGITWGNGYFPQETVTKGFRPVVNLPANLYIHGGDGSENNPYVLADSCI